MKIDMDLMHRAVSDYARREGLPEDRAFIHRDDGAIVFMLGAEAGRDELPCAQAPPAFQRSWDAGEWLEIPKCRGVCQEDDLDAFVREFLRQNGIMEWEWEEEEDED